MSLIDRDTVGKLKLDEFMPRWGPGIAMIDKVGSQPQACPAHLVVTTGAHV